MLSGGSMQQTKKNQGFTLIELMVTVAIMAIIATMAAPSFTKIIRKNQLNIDAQDFEDKLKETRSNALLKQREQSLSIDTSVVTAWKPREEIKWSPVPTTTTIAYNMLGLLTSTTNLCFILEHKKDSNLKAVIVVRRTGLVVYDKARTGCSNLGSD